MMTSQTVMGAGNSFNRNKVSCRDDSDQNSLHVSACGLIIGSPETRVFILVALARVNMSHWFNIMTRLASFYRK